MALRSLTSRLCSLATRRPGLHRMASTHVFEKFDDGLVIRQLTKEDLPTVQAWYEKNYNPSELGLVIDLYQADYPHCLLAAEQGGKLVGTASAVPICQRAVYAPEVVVPPGGDSGSSVGERLEGFRKNLWDRSHALVGDKERADRRKSNRGVGFTGLSYGLYEGTVTEVPEVPEHVKEISWVDFQQIVDFDKTAFYDPLYPKRADTLKAWLSLPGTRAYAVLNKGTVEGLGAMRPSQGEGTPHLVGPLYAESASQAIMVLQALTSTLNEGDKYQIEMRYCASGWPDFAKEFDLQEIKQYDGFSFPAEAWRPEATFRTYAGFSSNFSTF